MMVAGISPTSLRSISQSISGLKCTGSDPPPVTPISGSIAQVESEPSIGMGDKSDWRSIYVASFLSFCCAAQFSLYFSSLWPFLQTIDKSATERFFGYIVAVYSLGQILAAPVAGYLSNRFRSIRYLLYLGLALMFVGNAVYLSVQHLPKESGKRKFVLLIARFITGVGSSNISLLKSYASTASASGDRSRAIAFVTGGVALGATMGPAFQLLFTPIGYPGWHFYVGSVRWRLSMYTAPAYMACIMNAIGALSIKLLFREYYAGIIEKKSKSITPDGQRLVVPKYDRVAVLLCHLTRFTQMFVNTNIETIGTPLAALMFSWTHSQVIDFMATAQAIMSFLAFLTYIAFIAFRLDKIVNFRLNCMLSLFLLIVFHLLTYSYSFLPGQVKIFNNSDIINQTTPIGCNTDKFSWCYFVKPISPSLFFICYVLFIGVAFPNINIALNTLFSKIIGPRRQGTQQGILQMSGGCARMVGPVVISSLYTAFGPTMAWNVEIAVILATFLLWTVFYKRMIPLKLQTRPLTISSTIEPSPIIKSRRCDEHKPFIIITKEEESENDSDQRHNQLAKNNITVSTMCSIRSGPRLSLVE
ncbi:major facilitator superfamily domain-containing protein [Ditylenchus destructor]|uniref:Major facilitator superfamily domain-containing protein n=1 Tax=Ditylenchus destructor TaxID=166010 RepID=A0AAD4R113_9BILA|nr:major facilitator superfamily domain-containing protein [Ditylenchus destructor]